MDAVENISAGCVLTFIVLLVSCIPAWITHVIVTIQTEQWALLVMGGLIWPIGVVHGWGIWFGAF
jgi:hypothetical protein